MKKIYLFAALAVVMASLSNCKKTADAGPAGATGTQGPPGPLLMGNLEGYISLWDQYGARILTGQAGDTVSLIGTPTRVVTDSTGKYVIPNLTTGTYSLAISKAGYGNTMLQNIQLAGGGNTLANARISQPSTTPVPPLLDSIGATTGNITVYTTLPSPSFLSRTFILYVGNMPGVSANPATYLTFYTKVVNPGNNATRLSFTIPKTDLYDAGFTTGSTVYFAAYGIGASLTASAFTDYNNGGRTVFTALSMPAATTSLIVP